MSNPHYNLKTQEKTVEFKLDVSDENIRRNTMKIVWRFPVTFVDIKEKGILKVRGKFDHIEMREILQQHIDESVDLINPMKKSEKKQIPGLATVFNYFKTPATKEIVVFEFRVLDERIIPKAMEVIWEFPVTSVEIENDFYLKVKGGEINKEVMKTQLKDVDKHVKIKWHGQDVEEEPKKQSEAGGSKLQPEQLSKKKNIYEDAYGEHLKKQQGINQAKQPAFYDDWLLEEAHGRFNQQQGFKQENLLPIYGGAHAQGLYKQNANKVFQAQPKGGFAALNLGEKKKQAEVKKQNQDAGWFGNMFGNQQPQVKQDFRGKRENQHAQRIDPLIIQEFGSSSTRNRSSFSRSSSAMDLSQTTSSSSVAYSSYSTTPNSSRNSSHSRSRSSENLSQFQSNSTGNSYTSSQSNTASGSKQGQSSKKPGK
ncbi:hypothetical protein AtNW77_Chr5g0137671 [Arabidopsis thaliana]|nr:hypothetical protein ISN45_At05g048210 [Arabidopsis thaliana x Arabidopsis arenosa]